MKQARTKAITTYRERAVKQDKRAQEALLKSISNDWEVAKESVEKAAKLEIVAINRLRTAGIKLQEVCKREQVSFEFFHAIQSKLPASMHFHAVKFCVHLANKLPNPITTLDEARSARQMMFEALGESTAPKRLAQQAAHDRNPWSDFVSGASSFTSLFKELEAEPMEKWGADKLSTFVRETKPIVERHERAAKLLEK